MREVIMSGRNLAPGPGDALVVVDVQVDFLPGGRLAVPEGDQVVPVINRYRALFRSLGLPVYFTRDWHPADHSSFREQGGTWPIHCVQGTAGADFAPGLERSDGDEVISKADNPERDTYSGFDGTDLKEKLDDRHVRRVFVGGLATDYCVVNTVKDALENGYETVLLRDAVRAVDLEPGDSERAVKEMLDRGARETRFEKITS